MSIEKSMTLTTEANAIDSLEHALEALKKAKTDPMALKWFIIALHHATHCLMLAALAGSAQEGIWEEPVKYQEREDGLRLIDVFSFENKLFSFLKAYRMIKDPEKMRRYVNSKSFTAEPKHDEAMEFLNDDLRNTLIHFRPIVTGMDHGYVSECAPVIEVVEFLLFESGQIIHLAPDYDIERLRSLLEEMGSEITSMMGNKQTPSVSGLSV